MQPYVLFTYTSFRNMYPLSKIVPLEPLAERADTCERTAAYLKFYFCQFDPTKPPLKPMTLKVSKITIPSWGSCLQGH